jgi:hypothetical protein
VLILDGQNLEFVNRNRNYRVVDCLDDFERALVKRHFDLLAGLVCLSWLCVLPRLSACAPDHGGEYRGEQGVVINESLL